MMKLNLSDIRYNWVVIFIIQLLLSPGIDVFSQAMPVDTVYNQSYDWRPGQRETLPEWVFASQRKGRVVGISDPCMKSEAARCLLCKERLICIHCSKGTIETSLGRFFHHGDCQ